MHDAEIPKNPFESIFGSLKKPKEELTEQQKIGEQFLKIAQQFKTNQ